MFKNDDIRESYAEASRTRPASWNALKERGIATARLERSRMAHQLFRRLFALIIRSQKTKKTHSASSSVSRVLPLGDDAAQATGVCSDVLRREVLTGRQVELIKDSWKQVIPIAETAAALFYGRLFVIAPELKAHFVNTDMPAQGAKLLAALDGVINQLGDLNHVASSLRDLGARHAGYGVRAEHYEPVGTALLWTLEQGLGASWTEETADAWRTAYGVIVTFMLDGTTTPPVALAA